MAMFDLDMRYLAHTARNACQHEPALHSCGRHGHFPTLPERYRVLTGRSLAGETLSSTEDAYTCRIRRIHEPVDNVPARAGMGRLGVRYWSPITSGTGGHGGRRRSNGQERIAQRMSHERSAR